MKRVADEVDRQVADGVRPGVHICVDVGGEVVLDHRAGLADQPAGKPVDERTLFYTFSAVKSVWSTAVVQLADRGRLRLDAPVAEYIPEFAQNGKQDVTVRQVLSHRAGLEDAPGTNRRLLWYYHTPVSKQIADICGSAPEWEPGTAHGYHGLTLQPMCRELVARVTGRDPFEHVRDEVFGPLQIDDYWLGLPEEHEQRVAQLVDPSGAYGTPLIYNTRLMHAWPCGGFTNATNFARFFRGLLDAVLGRSGAILSQRAALEQTFVHTGHGRDRRLGSNAPWGLGLTIMPPWETLQTYRDRGNRGMAVEAMFGVRATPGTFGHAGNIFGSTAFADPGRDLVCVVMTNALLDMTTATDSMLAILAAVHDEADKLA